ncbi:surfeit locus 1 family protein [Pseudoduganella flava]|uniref:SURF1-like protein n=1 Tax=Pseudoduganella flava TaxID=871742 RepID=A0A562PRJ2_9BURK|nr:SURF1 family protein [Pseudoduganella flava]QGZ37941.1 SURF1 family protein [Pseudoduganella flava]TWI46780.1 surfeit locus 1 family protein [Pseudoduganella flava]
MNDAPFGAKATPHGNEAARFNGARIALAAAAAFFFCVFVSLGTWQVKRLQWKEDLIARVEARVHAEPVAAPRAAEWPQVTAASHEYRRVRVSGTLLYGLTTRVQTTTALGIGFWLMTPMCTEDGIVLVNRGFVAQQAGDYERGTAPKATAPVCPAAGPRVEVTGLLRLAEPKGRILRDNDPARDRWYTRDIAAIAQARGLGPVAPYFVDAEKGQEHAQAGEQVTAGLTVIAFPNNHLAYAGTWFALAAMVAGGYYLVLRYERTRKARGMDDRED